MHQHAILNLCPIFGIIYLWKAVVSFVKGIQLQIFLKGEIIMQIKIKEITAVVGVAKKNKNLIPAPRFHLYDEAGKEVNTSYLNDFINPFGYEVREISGGSQYVDAVFARCPHCRKWFPRHEVTLFSSEVEETFRPLYGEKWKEVATAYRYSTDKNPLAENCPSCGGKWRTPTRITTNHGKLSSWIIPEAIAVFPIEASIHRGNSITVTVTFDNGVETLSPSSVTHKITFHRSGEMLLDGKTVKNPLNTASFPEFMYEFCCDHLAELMRELGIFYNEQFPPMRSFSELFWKIKLPRNTPFSAVQQISTSEACALFFEDISASIPLERVFSEVFQKYGIVKTKTAIELAKQDVSYIPDMAAFFAIGFSSPDLLRDVIPKGAMSDIAYGLFVKPSKSNPSIEEIREYTEALTAVKGEKAAFYSCTSYPQYFIIFRSSLFDIVRMWHSIKDHGRSVSLKGRAEEIHDRMAKVQYRMECPNTPLNYEDEDKALFEREKNGFSFYLPRETDELFAAGAEDVLDNCLRYYYNNVLFDSTVIVLVKNDRDVIVAAIEVSDCDTVEQIKVAKNRIPTDDVKEAILWWLNEVGHAIIFDECKDYKRMIGVAVEDDE